jgi:hypothetical protein
MPNPDWLGRVRGAAASVSNQGVFDQFRGEILRREQHVVTLGFQPCGAQSGGSIRPQP